MIEPGQFAAGCAAVSVNDQLVQRTVDRLRNKLLDLTTRNPLLSFKHSSRSGRFVRVVDELPNLLFERLERLDRDATWRFRSLGDVDDEPADEQSASFRRALDAAKLEDQKYQQDLTALGEDPGEKAVARVEQELRMRVRERLGLPPRTNRNGPEATEVARRKGIDPSFDLPVVSSGDARHSDSHIQTLLFEGKMLSTLTAIRERVNLSLGESGVNPLFGVFGFLEWYEDENSEQPRCAPLLLYALTLHRDLVRGKYHYGISSAGEGAQANVALSARLKRDFDLVLPEFGEDQTPEDYFVAVQGIIQGKKGWRVRRWITVGLFSFAKIAMYHDLDPANWAHGEGLTSHPSLRRILSGEGVSGTSFGASEESESLAHVELEIPLVSDADSSQLQAIEDVLSGRSMVIEGPPGTGKSQTITNIIAAAMAAGKTVLFMAEKMAALNVVKDRLVHAGLGDFCLELHSTKVGRKEIAKQLASRLERPKQASTDAELAATVRDLGVLQRQLSACAVDLASPAGQLGVTVHDLFWKCSLQRRATEQVSSEIDGISLAGAEEMTELDVNRIRLDAQQLGRVRRAIEAQHGSMHNHPWRGIASREMGVMQAQDCFRAVERLAAAAARVASAVGRTSAATGVAISTPREFARIVPAASLSRPDASLDLVLVTRLADHQTFEAMRRFAVGLREHGQLLAELRGAFASELAADAADPDVLQDMARVAQVARADGITVSELGVLAKMERDDEQRLCGLHALVASAASKAGLRSVESRAVERTLVTAIQLAAEADRSLLSSRTKELTSLGAAALLDRAVTTQTQLRRRRDDLAARFSVSGLSDSATLRMHAVALRAAPALPFLSRRWWRARSAFAGLSISPTRLARGPMAAEFDGLATFVDERDAFVTEATVVGVLRGDFRGIDHDLELPMRIARWAAQVLGLTHVGEASTLLAQLLLEGAVEQVEGLAALAQHPSSPELCELAFREGVSVADNWNAAKRRADAAAKLAESSQKVGLRGDLVVVSLTRLAEVASNARRLRDELDHHRVAASTLGQSFQGSRGDPAALEAALTLVGQLNRLGLPTDLRAWVLGTDCVVRIGQLIAHGKEAGQLLDDLDSVLLALKNITPISYQVWLGQNEPCDASAREIEDRAQVCVRDPDGLQQLIEHARLRHELEIGGLGKLLDLMDRHDSSVDLGEACRRVVYQSIIREVVSRAPSLAGFSGAQHEGRRSQFRQLDRKLLTLRQRKIAADLSRRPVHAGEGEGPKSTWTGLALIRNEIPKQRRHISVRDLMSRAGKTVQQLMPCMMMSPLSVAQYLKPGAMAFDLVIMDEASQLRPEDAIGGIVRGKQMVVVGDPKQLPPTSFFVGSDGGDDASEADDSAADDESILDSAQTVMKPVRRLRWHYRSRHGSLIAFSNREFYDSQLVVFPAPSDQHESLGVSYVRVEDGRYGGSINAPEARRVAEEAVAYAMKHPDRSLGIVALNQKQAELLSLELDRLAAENHEFEAWRKRSEESLEPFFAKNLENVQGDERDTIFISTVYGRDEAGNFHQRFGPINSKGGHRRLNVLLTRAKYQLVVFSSMDPGDIVTDEASPWGVRVLKDFLAYAKTGVIQNPKETGKDPESPFEEAVRDALKAAGVSVVSQVGVAGYRIDLAVRHPQRPGEYVLGIECDGRMYHSTKSARDRDRLRQEILERLNWRIHRIWSVDWYAKPRQEAQRLLDVVKAAVQ